MIRYTSGMKLSQITFQKTRQSTYKDEANNDEKSYEKAETKTAQKDKIKICTWISEHFYQLEKWKK